MEENGIGRKRTTTINVLGGGQRGERAGRMGADSRREREREAAREKQEAIDKGLGDRHREMGTPTIHGVGGRGST